MHRQARPEPVPPGRYLWPFDRRRVCQWGAALQHAVQGVVLGVEQSRRDELVGLRDDLVIDQDLAVQVRSIRPLDGHFHARQLRVVRTVLTSNVRPGSSVGCSLLTFASSILYATTAPRDVPSARAR